MQAKLERDVRILKVYAVVATLVCALLLLPAFTLQGEGRRRFEEIDVERINIVEKDGKLRLVISNQERQHPGMVDGKVIPRPDGRPPGLIFFNHRGDEAGGLVFDECDGQGHFVSLTFDKSRQDQTIGIQHLESDNGQYFAGLTVWERPHNSLADYFTDSEAVRNMPAGPEKEAARKKLDETQSAPQRIMIGKLRDKSAVIALSDAQGRPRIRISVDEAGNARLSFLDEAGKVTHSLPE